MIVYTPIFYCAELKLAFKGKITRKVADTLHLRVPAGLRPSSRNLLLTSLNVEAVWRWYEARARARARPQASQTRLNSL